MTFNKSLLRRSNPWDLGRLFCAKKNIVNNFLEYADYKKDVTIFL